MNLPGWDVGKVKGINVDEQMIGYGVTPTGKNRGWVSKPPTPVSARRDPLMTIRILFGVVQDGGGVGTGIGGGPPFPIGPWGPRPQQK
jgi:hypothetical protein